LQSSYRARPRVPARLTRPGPEITSASLPTTRSIVVSTTGRPHYAANRLGESTGSEAERELKSKGLDNLHYSSRDTRSVSASDQPSCATGQVRNDRDRRAQVRIAQGSREVQAEHRRQTEATRKEIPLAKILDSTFWARLRLFEQMTFWVTFWAKPGKGALPKKSMKSNHRKQRKVTIWANVNSAQKVTDRLGFGETKCLD